MQSELQYNSLDKVRQMELSRYKINGFTMNNSMQLCAFSTRMSDHLWSADMIRDAIYTLILEPQDEQTAVGYNVEILKSCYYAMKGSEKN